jgi:transcriptional regulator with XRE-family HTH domain
MKENVLLARKIHDARIDLDMSQKEIANLIPMNQSNYSKIERGIQEPSVYQLKRISQILHISTDELLGINKVALEQEKFVEFQKELDKLYCKFFKE